jgi:hypothetical protein
MLLPDIRQEANTRGSLPVQTGKSVAPAHKRNFYGFPREPLINLLCSIICAPAVLGILIYDQ